MAKQKAVISFPEPLLSFSQKLAMQIRYIVGAIPIFKINIQSVLENNGKNNQNVDFCRIPNEKIWG